MKTITQDTLQKSLEYIERGDWDNAHRLIQHYSDSVSCQVHGYLHRIEGDIANAKYWYGRSGLDLPDNSLASELVRLRSMIGR